MVYIVRLSLETLRLAAFTIKRFGKVFLASNGTYKVSNVIVANYDNVAEREVWRQPAGRDPTKQVREYQWMLLVIRIARSHNGGNAINIMVNFVVRYQYQSR